VQALRGQGKRFVDKVPAADPALPSPCDF